MCVIKRDGARADVTASLVDEPSVEGNVNCLGVDGINRLLARTKCAL